MRKISKLLATLTLATAFAGGTAVAEAATQTGWTGPTLPVNGTAYLHNSTVTDQGGLSASTRMWTVTGNEVPAGTIGVRPRLFKSGILCEAIDYQYNFWPATEYSFGTTNTCGDGWYNSHGFVSVWNDETGAYVEYPTFPTNSIWVTGLNAASAGEVQIIDARSTSQTDEEIAPEAQDAPEGYTAAFGDSGIVGYVSNEDLDQQPVSSPAEAIQGSVASRSIPVYDHSGTEVIDSFTVGG